MLMPMICVLTNFAKIFNASLSPSFYNFLPAYVMNGPIDFLAVLQKSLDRAIKVRLELVAFELLLVLCTFENSTNASFQSDSASEWIKGIWSISSPDCSSSTCPLLVFLYFFPRLLFLVALSLHWDTGGCSAI